MSGGEIRARCYIPVSVSARRREMVKTGCWRLEGRKEKNGELEPRSFSLSELELLLSPTLHPPLWFQTGFESCHLLLGRLDRTLLPRIP